jgi:hypothetical protein
LARVSHSRNRLYMLRLEVARPVCLTARRGDDAWLWHDWFGHVNFGALQQMGRRSMVRGLPQLAHVEQLCDVCVTTKHQRAPFPKQARYRADKPLELVHGDFCGPIMPATPRGRHYILLLVEDATRYMWVAFLAEKSSTPESIKKIQAAAESKCGRKLRVFCTNNVGKFTLASFPEYFAGQGVERHQLAPHTPQQNDVVEQRNQTVVAMVRALLKQRGMPAIYWAEALNTAMFLLNRSTTRALSDKMPYEAWHGSKPVVQFLHTFGCPAYVKELGHHGKIEDRSMLGVFIGYEEGVKAYRVLDPMTQRVRTTRDVVFDEDRSWNWS